MASYTRQSSFADGDTITAALFNNEFNQLVNAFHNSTGHKHDGTTAEGPVIGLIGDAGETSPNNKVLIDTTNNFIEFYVEVSSSPVQQLYISDGAIVPVTDSDVDLGTTSLRFKDTYTDTVTTTGNVSVGGNLTVTGTATIAGNLTFGDAASDTVAFSADVASNLLPSADNTYDLGASGSEWKDLYIDGTANIDSLVADTADINGGTVDGAIIGGSSAAAITGTAITGTSFVIGSATITEAELEILDGASLSTDEINLLDGVTATTAELNILDGVTSTAAELNILDGVTSTAAELNILDGVTSTAAEINILDGVTATATELNLIDGVTATTDELNILDGVTASATDINLIDGITNGTVIASKAIITDANKDISGGRNITISGELDAATLDISGDADIDGTLEADAITIGGVTLAETISDTVGAMVSSNTETNITVTYEDSDNTLDFAIGTLNQDTTGNAATATALETARTIHGVSFDGTANIDLSEVIADTVGAMVSSNTETNITVAYQDTDNTLDFTIGTLNQDTTGLAGTATALATARTIGGTSFDGTANIAVNLAATATALATARTIHGVSFDGTANIDLSEVVQDTVGAMFSSNTESGITVAYEDGDGTIDLTVGTLNQNTTGSAATLTTARTIGGVSFDGSANITPTTFTAATFSGDLNVDSGVLFADVSANRVGINQASPDVSLDLGANTDAVHMPVGTTAQRPTGANGYFRYNSDDEQFEGYADGAWGAIAGSGGGSAIEPQIFAGDGSDTTFTLTSAPTSENNLLVFIDGAFQAQNTYSVSGTTLTFSTAPANTRVVTVYHARSSISGSNMIVDTMTGDNSDTTLTLSVAPVSENNVQVYFDGVYQSKANYSISGTTLTFSTAPATGVAVEAISFTQTSVNAPTNDSVATATIQDGAVTSAKLASGVGGVAGITSSADATAITIDSSERVGINTGSPAKNLDVSGEIRASTGILFGTDTAAANTLDDYEEGTWTPALDNVTTNSSTMYGIYTKIGNICHIHAKISVTVASLPGVQFQISGLPFAATNTSDTGQRAIIAIGGDCLNAGAVVNGRAQFITNGSTLQGIYLNSGGTATYAYNGIDSSTFELHIHGFYTTT